MKIIGENKVQRDLYSAFIISCANENLNRANREKCLEKFPNFIELMNKEISWMKEQGLSKKECFGF